MLYLEEGRILNLLPGVPRNWLEDGKEISLKNVASYFGPLSLSVTSHVNDGSIDVKVSCSSDRRPDQVRIRIPHPKGLKAISVIGGVYNPETESVLISNFQGEASLKIEY
jgi:hypothetical protein